MDGGLTQRTAAPRGRVARRGFTLIELMTVVCIIGILLSILIPSFKRARADGA